jgi:hypothetical protein
LIAARFQRAVFGGQNPDLDQAIALPSVSNIAH